MTTRPNVYIINRSPHDFSDAKRFGDLVYLSDGPIDKFATNHITRMFAPIIEASEPQDYILLTALTVMCCIAVGMFARKHGMIRLLLHRSDGTYVERVVMLDGIVDPSIPEIINSALNDSN